MFCFLAIMIFSSIPASARVFLTGFVMTTLATILLIPRKPKPLITTHRALQNKSRMKQ